KYYRYHRDHSHDTEECRQLKNQIEDLIRKRHLRKEEKRHLGNRRSSSSNPEDIDNITGGVASGGDHKNARKTYGRQSLAVQGVYHSKRLKTGGDKEVITFSEPDYEGVRLPHDDPVVVTLLVELFTMKRILIDSGSSAGTTPRQTQVEITFLVVDTPSPYNAIVGRPSLNLMEAIVSTRHLLMKFPTRFGVGEVRGDQQAVRQ
ncbi:LOW QUALITY PROTEIN: hypothetical protein CFOL_v3_09588, partial [Cephalotus follicularis]